ncbi:MAG: CBS domain-containing protein [Magnetococcales bacterium]|nr:CBS domain-containing protein [Magnetococcales bacterium]
MFVSRIMIRQVVTIDANTNLIEMTQLMKEHNINHLPVLEKGRLIGLVCEDEIKLAAPSSVSTLSVNEANYLLDKVTAKTIMQRKVVTCSPDTLVEEAGLSLRQNQITCLPVVERDQLVGIVTTGDLLDFFLDITGCTMEETTRLALHLPDKTGELTALTELINRLGGYIATIVSPVHPDETGLRIVIVRYRAQNPHQLAEALIKEGYDVISEHRVL